ncbi:hypothetical protein E7747_16245 (plasmid) [Duncaniella dubosii]|uniref:Uncharacterized protein n=1 Tax=Duncaniella dubosii TaxID=2518971 RepID=A0A4P7W8L2_9BACT|nr:hypothetical protein E7747_16245 [Duncaniella dubosii]
MVEEDPREKGIRRALNLGHTTAFRIACHPQRRSGSSRTCRGLRHTCRNDPIPFT